ncbi:MAG: hypothetical protein K2N46_05580 [Lachnospiraceae bacterium]|nr:hypothetical protein [Lachnospiraceae bacterium]
MIQKLLFILDMNNISAENEPEFDRIVILTDRDEWNTEQNLIHAIMEAMRGSHMKVNEIKNNQWCDVTYHNGRGKELQMKLLLLVIPFTGTGALETFLLDSVSGDNAYDANIISQCKRFVDNIDPQKRYLRQRRHVTKAKFNVYFAVRAAEEQFVERQNVLLSVPWEQYHEIQKDFKKLGELSGEA